MRSTLPHSTFAACPLFPLLIEQQSTLNPDQFLLLPAVPTCCCNTTQHQPNSLFAGACCPELLVSHQLSHPQQRKLADAPIIHIHLQLTSQQRCALVYAITDSNLAALGLAPIL
jgi:hypothetical protein